MLNVNSKCATKEATKMCLFRSPLVSIVGMKASLFGQNIHLRQSIHSISAAHFSKLELSSILGPNLVGFTGRKKEIAARGGNRERIAGARSIRV